MHWWLIILVAAHLVCVNLAGSGPLVAVWMEWRGTRRGLPDLFGVSNRLAGTAIGAAAVGIAIGLVAMAFVTTPSPGGAPSEYAQVLKRLSTDRLWFAIAEVAFYFACMAGYAVLLRRPEHWRIARRVLAIAAGTNLLYHFPALFTILAIVPTRPALLGMPIDRAVFHQLLLDPETLSRVIHVWLASFAIGGMMLAWIGWHETRRKLQPSLEQAVASGGRLATVATLLQIPVGIWVLSTLPQEQQDRLLGDNSICTLLLGLSVLGSLALLHPLAMVALGERSTRRLAAATGLMVAVICMMTAALQCARS